MKNLTIKCGSIEISNSNNFCLIAGPCQLETEQHAMDMAGKIKDIASKFKIGFIYKTSFDKANRTSLKGKRGVDTIKLYKGGTSKISGKDKITDYCRTNKLDPKQKE